MKRKASELSISSESRIKIQKIDELDDETTTFSMYKAENYNEILEFYNLEKINGNRYFSSEEKEQSSSKFFAWIKEIRIGVGINVAINKKEKETFYFIEAKYFCLIDNLSKYYFIFFAKKKIVCVL
jgi:hypothetical protein